MELIPHLADEMTRLFISGHDVEQTAAYETARREYIRAEAEKVWQGVGLVPPPDAQLG